MSHSVKPKRKWKIFSHSVCLWPDKVVISGRRIGYCRILVILTALLSIISRKSITYYVKYSQKKKNNRKSAFIVGDLSEGNLYGKLVPTVQKIFDSVKHFGIIL